MQKMPISTRFVRVAASLAYASATLASQAQTLEPDQLFEKISPSVWVVTTFDSSDKPLAQGSAVVIAPGTLVTNCHVLAKSRGFVVKRDNVAFGATLEHADVDRDLCQIQVKNFTAPAVDMAPTGSLRVGQKVYAIGNPRGLELTFSDGMISGLRKSDDDKTVELVQTTAPISPGSSGGGLFDAQGRLVGITTGIRRDSQNLNFAMPADWVKEVPTRAKEALAKRQDGETRVSAAGQPVSRRGPYYVGQSWGYALVDKLTNLRQSVELRVDRFEGDNVVFNGGRRVETLGGRVVRSDKMLAELDAVNAAGGWIGSGTSGARAWSIKVAASDTTRLELDAVFSGESRITTAAGDFDVQVFRFSGFRYSRTTQFFNTEPYEATAWFAPRLGRIVKFAARSLNKYDRFDEEVLLERFDQ